MQIKWFGRYCEKMLLLLLAAIYFFERSREPALGDALSFTVAATKGFDWASNATNHIFYINFLHGLKLMFPFVKPHFLFQMVSLLSAVGSLYLLSVILKMLNIRVLLRCLAIAVFGLSFTFWRHAEIVEVYTLNLIFTAVTIIWFLKWQKDKNNLHVFKASALLGVAMLIHVQQILYVPFLAYWCYLAFSFKIIHWLKAALAFLIPSSLLLIPVAFELNTLSSILFDSSFEDEVTDISFSNLISGLIKSVGLTIFNFGAFTLLFIPAIFKVKTFRQIHLGLIFMAAVVFVFAARYNVSDNYVFFIPAHFIFVILMAVYLNAFKVHKKIWSVALVLMLMATPFVYILLPKLVQSFGFGHEMENDKWYKGGARFFFYPGMAKNPTSIDLAKSIKNGEIEKNFNLEIEQNFEKAIWYYEQRAN